jgi:hypothetical protein
MIEVSILDNGKVNGKVIKRFSAEKRKEINAEKMKELKNRFTELKLSAIRLDYLSKNN